MSTDGILTDSQLAKLISLMKDNAIKPKKVNSKRMARIMTLGDLNGVVWYPGDEYYELHTVDGIKPVKLSYPDEIED